MFLRLHREAKMCSCRRLILICYAVYILPVYPKTLKRPCSGPLVLDLLGLALRESSSANWEVESYARRKGYRFSATKLATSVDAPSILPSCEIFPSEFSFIISFKAPVGTVNSEYLASFLAPDRETVLMAIRYKSDWLFFDYVDDFNAKQSLRVQSNLLRDGNWHDLIVAVSEEEVTFIWDCGIPIRRASRGQYHDNLKLKNTKFYVASRRKKRGRFTGLIQQVKLVIGSDATALLCRSSPFGSSSWEKYTHPRKDIQVTPVEIDDGSTRNADCSAENNGHLVYRAKSRRLEMCESSRWESLQTGDERLDYVDDFSNLKTKSKTLDFELFRIPEKGLFMAAANQGRDRDMNSTIYKWDENEFVPYQNLTTDVAQDWEYFRIGDDHFLACANQGADERSPHATSTMYRWSETKRKFVPHQRFESNAAQSFESFSINGKHYLAMANYGETEIAGDTGNSKRSLRQKSFIFEWQPDRRVFTVYQTISTIGCVDLEYFEAHGNHYLAAANSYDGDDSRIDSVIYKWQQSKFVAMQYIETIGAQDFEHFKIGNRHYLAVANYYDYRRKSYSVNSYIYGLAESGNKFTKLQDIPTIGAFDCEFFHVGKDSFIIFGSSSDRNSKIDNTIYRWQGMEHFVPVHTLSVNPSSDWEMFDPGDGRKFLVTANVKGKNNKLLKILTY